MNSRRPTGGQLRGFLTALGYAAEEFPTHVVFRHPDHALPIILPPLAPTDAVSSLCLGSVFETLRVDEVVDLEADLADLLEARLASLATKNAAEAVP